MTIPYRVLDVRFTQSHGWVIDGFLNKDAILPISIPFDYHVLYQPGFCLNTRRNQIKQMFEFEVNRLWIERNKNG